MTSLSYVFKSRQGQAVPGHIWPENAEPALAKHHGQLFANNIEVQSEGLQLQLVSLLTEGCIKPGCQMHCWMTQAA